MSEVEESDGVTIGTVFLSGVTQEDVDWARRKGSSVNFNPARFLVELSERRSAREFVGIDEERRKACSAAGRNRKTVLRLTPEEYRMILTDPRPGKVLARETGICCPSTVNKIRRKHRHGQFDW